MQKELFRGRVDLELAWEICDQILMDTYRFFEGFFPTISQPQKATENALIVSLLKRNFEALTLIRHYISPSNK
ncbi:MAG: hypothetical protein CMH70_05855 [Nitrosomonadaceae bacterium]|nr:hypothetical protein [Nitrosomonadaceae bacterium]